MGKSTKLLPRSVIYIVQKKIVEGMNYEAGKVEKGIIDWSVGTVILILCTAAGMSLVVGKQVAEGLLYMNRGNDTKQNSIDQLEVWGFDLEAFRGKYAGEDITLEASDGVINVGIISRHRMSFFKTVAELKRK